MLCAGVTVCVNKTRPARPESSAPFGAVQNTALVHWKRAPYQECVISKLDLGDTAASRLFPEANLNFRHRGSVNQGGFLAISSVSVPHFVHDVFDVWRAS